jgi:hypothetical protein
VYVGLSGLAKPLQNKLSVPVSVTVIELGKVFNAGADIALLASFLAINAPVSVLYMQTLMAVPVTVPPVQSVNTELVSALEHTMVNH